MFMENIDNFEVFAAVPLSLLANHGASRGDFGRFEETYRLHLC
jgi:hypothetical protein